MTTDREIRQRGLNPAFESQPRSRFQGARIDVRPDYLRYVLRIYAKELGGWRISKARRKEIAAGLRQIADEIKP